MSMLNLISKQLLAITYLTPLSEKIKLSKDFGFKECCGLLSRDQGIIMVELSCPTGEPAVCFACLI